MKINKVKLRDRGLKGIEVTIEKFQEKNQVSFRVEAKEKRSAPAHEDLTKCFEWLEKYILKITTVKDMSVEVNEVSIKNSGYILTGTLFTPFGHVNINTPILDEEFEDFKDLDNICKALFSEAKEYMEEKKLMSVDTYIKKKEAKNQEFNEKEYEALSKEEKLKVYVKLIEEAGGMVLLHDDVELESQNTDSNNMIIQNITVSPEPVLAKTNKQENNNALSFDL